VKKSGKTFLAAVIAIWEAVTNADCEVVCCANDQEQAVSRVFQTVCQLIKYNAELTSSATIQATQVKFTNGSVIRAVSSDYKGQAGGRQRLTIFDEIWAFDHERMTRLFEEMTPPGAYILIVSYAGFTSEGELLENLYKRGLKGKRIHKSLECYRAQGLFMFWSHRKRQPWQLGSRDAPITKSKREFSGLPPLPDCTATSGFRARACSFFRSNGTHALIQRVLPYSRAACCTLAPTLV
jgi:hypothetical protein